MFWYLLCTSQIFELQETLRIDFSAILLQNRQNRIFRNFWKLVVALMTHQFGRKSYKKSLVCAHLIYIQKMSPNADRLGDLFTYISYVNFMKNWGNSSLIKSLKTFLPAFSEIVRKFEGYLAYSSTITPKIYA